MGHFTASTQAMPPTAIALQLASRIKDLRLQKEWTREMLAYHSGVNKHTLKHFERTGQISLERLILICRALDIIDEIRRLFKPRHRIDIDNWQVDITTQRRRGRRNIMSQQHFAKEQTQLEKTLEEV